MTDCNTHQHDEGDSRIEQNLSNCYSVKVHIWSDGCAAQLHSQYVFILIARINRKYQLTWCYNEHHYGKSPMGSAGGKWAVSVRRKSLTQNHLQNKQITQLMVSSLYICVNVMLSKNHVTSRMPQRLLALWTSIKFSGNSMMTMYVN